MSVWMKTVAFVRKKKQTQNKNNSTGRKTFCVCYLSHKKKNVYDGLFVTWWYLIGKFLKYNLSHYIWNFL